MKNLIAIVLVLAAACSKSEDTKPADKPVPATKVVDKKPEAPEAPKPQPLPIKAFVELDTKELAFKPQAVLGKTPEAIAKELPQYLRKDKPSAAASKRTEAMMADMKKQVEAYGVDTTKRTEVEIRLPPTPASKRPETHVILHQNRETNTVRLYGVWFDTTVEEADQIMKTFDELWGAHKVVKETLGPRATWFDAKTGVRASTKVDRKDRLDVDYVRYTPLANFFGEPGALWGFEKAERPLIGATVEQLKATYGDAIEAKDGEDMVKMHLPPTDYDGDSSKTLILMFLERGKVRMWNTSIPFKYYEPARAEYEALLDAKFGKPKKARREHLIYGKKVDVEYSKFTNEINIEVSR